MSLHYLHQQSGRPDYRLIEVYGEEQCKRWEKECPEYLAYQSFEISQGHKVESLDNLDISDDYPERLESLDPVNFPVDEPEFFGSKRFNPFRYNLNRSYLKRKYYSIGKTGKILILFSGEELRKLFNSFDYSFE